MSVPQPVPKWDVQTVCNFIDSIGLASLSPAFKENAVAGSDLIELTDEDFTDSLGCTKLQAKKIRRELEAFGVHLPSNGTPAAVTPPADVPVAAAAFAPAAAAAAAPAADAKVAVKDEIASLTAKAAEAQRGAQAYSGAAQLLKSAAAKLGSAQKCLGVTQISNVTEGMQDVRLGDGRIGAGGMLRGNHLGAGRVGVVDRRFERRQDRGHDAVEIATVHRAKKQVQEAGAEIERARQLVPQLPFIQPANVKGAQTAVMFDAVFGQGLVGNVVEGAKLHSAKKQIQAMQAEVMQALEWCSKSAAAAQNEAAQCQGAISAKQSLI